jgi:hypothetical protein
LTPPTLSRHVIANRNPALTRHSGRAMTKKKLPIGIQTFREIRENAFYYVDKTGFAAQLVTEGKYYTYIDLNHAILKNEIQ